MDEGILGLLTDKMLVYETTIKSLKHDVHKLKQNDVHHRNIISSLIKRIEDLEKKDIANDWI